MIRRYIIEADDSLKGFDEAIEKLEREWGAEEIEENYEALDMANKALEQQPITWIVGKDNCQVAVRNMPIDKMQKICAIIGEEERGVIVNDERRD